MDMGWIVPAVRTSTELEHLSESRRALAGAPGTFAALRMHAVLLIAIAALTAGLYSKVLAELVKDWWNDPDYKHGFLVPVFVGYVLWRERDRYRNIALAPSNWGAVIIFFAIALLFAGTLGADAFISRVSLWVLLAGIILYLCGKKTLRAFAFPLGYLAFMIPLPLLLYNQLTFPLQLLASRMAAALIELSGVPVFREGNILTVPHYSAEVAVACSGIRSLLSLAAFSVAYGYLAEARASVRVTLFALAIPLAVTANAVRITVTSLIGYKFGLRWAEGFTHLFSGWLIFVFALLLLIPLCSFLIRISNRMHEKENAG
jgi:exosortase